MKPKYSTKKSLLFRVTPHPEALSNTVSDIPICSRFWVPPPRYGTPSPCGVGGPVGGWVGGEVEHEVEGISEKWWMLAPDE